MESTQVAEEVVQEEQVSEEVVDTRPDDELSYEELKQRYEELRKKNESAEDVAKRLKDEKSQMKRQEQELAKQQEIAIARQEFLASTIDEIINSDGSITDEHISIAKEKGITPEQLELSLYKTRERLNQIYDRAGGKDRYFDMVETVKGNVDEKTQQAFKQLLSNPDTYEIALEALESKYSKLSGNSTTTKDSRIVAKDTVEMATGIYKDINEYYADMRKMRAMPSGKQGEFRKQIESKLNKSKLV